MKWITHLVCAFCFVYIISLFIPISYAGFLLALICSVAPDYLEVVLRIKHRGVYLHNWMIPILTIPLIVNPTLAGFPLGYGHHLALDSITKNGVYIGSKKKIRGHLYALNPVHNAAIILLHCVALMFFLAS